MKFEQFRYKSLALISLWIRKNLWLNKQNTFIEINDRQIAALLYKISKQYQHKKILYCKNFIPPQSIKTAHSVLARSPYLPQRGLPRYQIEEVN